MHSLDVAIENTDGAEEFAAEVAGRAALVQRSVVAEGRAAAVGSEADLASVARLVRVARHVTGQGVGAVEHLAAHLAGEGSGLAAPASRVSHCAQAHVSARPHTYGLMFFISSV